MDAFVVRFDFGAARKDRGNLGKIDTPDLDQSNEKLRQEVDSKLCSSLYFQQGFAQAGESKPSKILLSRIGLLEQG